MGGDFIQFTVNGKTCIVNETLPRDTSLNAYLRYSLALPGTKAMCHQGGCGSCIVAVTARRAPSGEPETFSVNSCLVLVFSCHGWEVTTVEGAGDRRGGYSEVQRRIAAFNGSQCGYCTPGWVMQMTSLLDKHLTMAELEESFGSNTCRCTGYRPILDTMKSFAVDASPNLAQQVADIEDASLCKRSGKACQETCSGRGGSDHLACARGVQNQAPSNCDKLRERKCSEGSDGSDWSVISDGLTGLTVSGEVQRSIDLEFGKQRFHKVFDEEQIFKVLDREGYDSYMLVCGNTGKGLLESYEYPRILVDISDVKSLKDYVFDQNLVLGANMTLEDTLRLFSETAAAKSDFGYLSEFAKHFEKIAHLPVRLIGSLAGNLMLKHAHPTFQSDVFLLFATVRAVITVRGANGDKTTLGFTDFLKHDMAGKLMVTIALPPLSSAHHIRTYKVMPRNQNALAIMNAAFLVKLNKRTNVVEDASVCYGNVAPDFVHAVKTEDFLQHLDVFRDNQLQATLQVLERELIVKDEPPKASPQARKKLALGLFYKFILSIAPKGAPSPPLRSGGLELERPLSHGHQDFQTDPALYPLNQPVTKLEAHLQSAGEAHYANDCPPLPREVFAAFVLSTVHKGELDQIDGKDVLAKEGAIALLTAKDIPGKNSFAAPGIQLQIVEEEILASNNILFYGQPVAILVANTERLAAHLAKQVKVTYKNVSSAKPVLTIGDAKKDSQRYLASPDNSIKPKGRGTNVTKVIKGVLEIEAQYHYYLEPVTCVVVPVDDGLDVHDSTQWIDLSQIAIARALAINESDVHLKVRRIGGGFGGKISRNVQASTACAVVARRLNTACRFVLPLETNLTVCGRRLPCQTTYEAGVDDDGKIQYLEAAVVEDKGCSANEDILSYLIGGFPNCYVPDYFHVTTANVLTDLPSNTFMRGPGDLEAITSMEHIMEHIAFAVKKDPTEVRLANMRTEDNDLPELIRTLKTKSDYEKRYRDIQDFNKANRWMKKSIKITVMLFPVIYYGNYTAFVSIYRYDGTVTVSTGGVEMGQGINTKAAQVCAYILGIPLECVTVIPNYSFVCANNVFSGSSITSESVCYSVIKACEALKARLEPIKQKLSNPSWAQLIKQAGDDEINLTAEFMMTDKEPDLSAYSAFAVTVLETQLDVLTGRFQILRVDILEDVGLSANPQLDVGQVEGGYVQGLGYYTSEKLVYDVKTGRLLTNTSLNYHVPLALDIPADFRVYLRYNSKNPKGVLSSKAVGELGACSSHGILHALRQCIMESRKDSGYDPTQWIYIDVPYDTESILKALDVKIEEFCITGK